MKNLNVFLTVLTIAATSFATNYYTFDSSNEGWQATKIGYNGGSYETIYPNYSVDWTSSYGVGSPDGSIYQTSGSADQWEGRPYWMGTKGLTPGIFGDLAGKTLEAYIRSTANWIGRVSADIVYARWTISQEIPNSATSNMWVSKAAVSFNLNDSAFGSGTDNDWVLKQIEIKQENFFQWPNSSNGGSFSDAVKYYTSFGIAILPTAQGSDDIKNWNGASETWGSGYTLLHYGATANSSNTTATWGIDGFRVVPEPATIGLLGLGALTLLRKRK